jgi:hypothetical protein
VFTDQAAERNGNRKEVIAMKPNGPFRKMRQRGRVIPFLTTQDVDGDAWLCLLEEDTLFNMPDDLMVMVPESGRRTGRLVRLIFPGHS